MWVLDYSVDPDSSVSLASDPIVWCDLLHPATEASSTLHTCVAQQQHSFDACHDLPWKVTHDAVTSAGCDDSQTPCRAPVSAWRPRIDTSSL